jgi:hypothetical protein
MNCRGRFFGRGFDSRRLEKKFREPHGTLSRGVAVHHEKPLIVILKDSLQGSRFRTPRTVDAGCAHDAITASRFVPS